VRAEKRAVDRRILVDDDRRRVDHVGPPFGAPLTAGARPLGPTRSGGSPCGRVAPATAEDVGAPTTTAVLSPCCACARLEP
jgi:hypothetical protein